MRNIALIAIALIGILFTACNNELDLLGDEGQVAVVYGIVNMSDTATYVRVEKSFADPNISPIQLAKDPSLLYYEDVLVELFDVQNSGTRYTLKRVDGNKEGFVREAGAFAEAPNYLYKIMNDNMDFPKNSTVRLEIYDIDTDTLLAASTTKLINKIGIQYPNATSVGGSLRMVPGTPYKIRLNSGIGSEGDISYFIASVSYIVKGYNRDSQEMLYRIPQEVYTNEYKSQYDIEFHPEAIFGLLGETLTPNVEVYHKIDSVFVNVSCYGLELNEYKDIQLLNSGITSSSVVPTYNNIEKGQGLFTSGSSASNGPFLFSFITIDSLNKYENTKGLNFRP